MPEQKKTNRAMRRKRKNRSAAASTPSLKSVLHQPSPAPQKARAAPRPFGGASRFRGK